MLSRWDESEAAEYASDPVAMRAYSSRLLGAEPALVLHGGGNTSVKVREADFFGDEQDILYVKGSGWDLATIEPAGFSPAQMEPLLRLAALPSLSDTDLVRLQRAALTNPDAPNPSIEALVHAIIGPRFVDHTHADAVVALSNTPGGAEAIAKLYGDRVVIIPYVMPGFVLARAIAEITEGLDWSSIEGLILLSHGVFTFADDARTAYERMIRLVSEAEEYLAEAGAMAAPAEARGAEDLVALAGLRRAVSVAAGRPMVALLDAGREAAGFAGRADVASIANRGPLTPDHVIRTKRTPLILGADVSEPADLDAAVEAYAAQYRGYFEAHEDGSLTCLDPAPRWAVWPGRGLVAFGPGTKRAGQVADISRHTARAIQWAEALGGWTALPQPDIFAVEYWELEQAKLRKGGKAAPLSGKVAIVTGAASGIGRACAEQLRSMGAAIACIDIKPEVAELFDGPDAVGIVCDVTHSGSVAAAVAAAVRRFGALDILVSNAGTFPPSQSLADIDDATWRRTLDINLSSHQRVLSASTPFLVQGMDPAVVVVASKNVPAPGPGVAAYSVAKAGLTQLARVAALELGPVGVRVNVVHPNAVFDTGLWDRDKIESRATRYGKTVDQYKRDNVLGVEVGADDVARAVVAFVGPTFACTTGAQIAVDGGNVRVI